MEVTSSKKDESNVRLPSDIIRSAFAYFKEHEDFISILAKAGLKPGPGHKVPVSHDYKNWTLEEWAGFLYQYVTPRKR